LQEKSKLTLRTLPSACATRIVPRLLPNQQIDLLERKKWPEKSTQSNFVGHVSGYN